MRSIRNMKLNKKLAACAVTGAIGLSLATAASPASASVRPAASPASAAVRPVLSHSYRTATAADLAAVGVRPAASWSYQYFNPNVGIPYLYGVNMAGYIRDNGSSVYLQAGVWCTASGVAEITWCGYTGNGQYLSVGVNYKVNVWGLGSVTHGIREAFNTHGQITSLYGF